MSIEKRLADHMAEQSERLSFPASDPTELVHRSPSRSGRVVTTLAAVAVVLAAGIGFWSLSNGPTSTGIATNEGDGQAVDADEGSDGATGDGQGSGDSEATNPAAGGPFVALTVTDVTSDRSPGSGQVTEDGGVYYVLSTAPGRVRLDDDLSEDEWNRLFRPNTFYSFVDGTWENNRVEDRFISDFSVEDGVLYAISTGTLSGDETTALGTSSDRGRSWDWQSFGDLPVANQVGLLTTGDSTVFVASRWGSPGYEETLRLARDAGVEVSEETLRNFDSVGFSYIPIDGDDPCALTMVRYGLADMTEWLRTVSDEDREMAQQEIDAMMAEIGPELEADGCTFDLESLDDIDVPQPLTVTWEEIDVAVPERWKPWSGAFRYRDGQLTELSVPWDDGQQVTYTETADGELAVVTFPLRFDEEPLGSSETRWTTTDGDSWSEQVYDYDGEGEWYGPGHTAPRAGDIALETYWEEPTPEQMEAYEDQAQAFERGEIDQVDDGLLAQFEATRLRRSIDGGPWEPIEVADLVPDIDLGGRVLQYVQGTDYGIFLFFSRVGHFEPPEPGQLVLYSNNGTDWGSFETTGEWFDLRAGGDDLLGFDNRWIETETGGRQETSVLLLTPEG